MQKIVDIDAFKMKKQEIENNILFKYDVAQYFLNKNPLSIKELQILCFYAYSWYYALYEKELFKSKFIIKNNYTIDLDLKEKYKNYKTNKIVNIKDIKLDRDIEIFLDHIFDIYTLFHHLELYKLIEFEIKEFNLNNLNNDKLKKYILKYGNLINSPTDVIYNIKINLNNILEETEY